jgi:hypothetical protein
MRLNKKTGQNFKYVNVVYFRMTWYLRPTRWPVTWFKAHVDDPQWNLFLYASHLRLSTTSGCSEATLPE